MYLEALTVEASRIFSKLKNFPSFYLVGGTALALQIGHRTSVDFDLFLERQIPVTLLANVEKTFTDFSIDVRVNNPDELTVFLDSTKLTFFRYPFPVILELLELQGVKMLSVKEIAATKAYTLGRRASYKDYVDLYFILREQYSSLRDIIEISEKKYGDKFDPRLFLEQLIYLEDVTDLGIQFLKNSISKEEMVGFFQKEIQKLRL